MRPRTLTVLAIVTAVLGVVLIPTAYAQLKDDRKPTGGNGSAAAWEPPPPPPPPTLTAKPVAVKVDGFLSWALLDRKTNKISGSANIAETNSTESMIKIWIVADYLRQLGDKPLPPDMKKRASTAIRDSDDDATEAIYRALGGYKGTATGVMDRMISTCGMTDSKPAAPPGKTRPWWSFTRISARDAVRLADCVKTGKAAGPVWTDWLLNEMAEVRGSTAAKDQQPTRGGGRWGIIDGLPEEILAQGPVSMKNGWTRLGYDNQWHLNCLAVTDAWALAVLMRYPAGRPLDYGAKVCAEVTSQLVTGVPTATTTPGATTSPSDEPSEADS